MKFVLDKEELTNAFFEGSRLLGIMAPMKDYQFCWQLNNQLEMDFRINNDIEIQLTRKRRNYFFTVFEYLEPMGPLSHYIYKNQFEGEYLLSEFKHLDFLWLMRNDVVRDESLAQIINSVKNINGVQLVVELTNEKIKNKENLLF
jgi:hypothetical protein